MIIAIFKPLSPHISVTDRSCQDLQPLLDEATDLTKELRGRRWVRELRYRAPLRDHDTTGGWATSYQDGRTDGYVAYLITMVSFF